MGGKGRTTGFFVVLIGCLFLGRHARAEDPPRKAEFVLRWGSLAPQGTAYTEALENYKKYLDERTQGRIKNLLYMGGVVGDEPDMIKKMRIGQLDVGGFTMKGTYAALSELTVFGLPFLFEDYDEADYVMISMFNDIDDIMIKKGFKVIDLVEEGFDIPYSKNKVELPDGFKGQRVWNWSAEPVGLATFKALGVESPLQTPVPEVLTSLQTGLLNVVTASPLAAVGLQWSAQVKYAYDMPLYYDPGVVLMNKTTWDKLPADLQGRFVTMRQDLSDYFFQIERPDQERAMQAMVQHGVQVITPDAATLKVLKDRTRPVWDELADKVYSRAMLDRILKFKKEWADRKLRGTAGPLRKKVVAERLRIKLPAR